MNRISSRTLFLITALLIFSVVNAQENVVELSLQDAISFALRNNDSLKNARLDVLIQYAKNAEITGQVLPNVNGDGQLIAYPNPVKSFIPTQFFDPTAPPGSFTAVQFTPKYGANANLSASQILFNGSLLVALQARKAIIQLVEQGVQLSEVNVRYGVTQAYNSLVVAQKQFGILKNSLGNARSLLNDVRIIYETGFAEKIEVDRSSVRVNNLATDSIRISNLLSVSEQLLKYRMGMDINQPITLADTSLNQTILSAQAMLNDELNYNNRTEYTLLESQLLLNEYDLKRHKLAGLPSLAAFGGATYTYSTNTFGDLFNKPYIFISSVGLRLNVPVFDGFQRRNRVKQAKLNIEKTRNTLDNAKLGIDFQTQVSRTTLKNNLLAFRSQESNLSLAYSVFDLAEKKYKAGVGSNLEVTQAQTEYLQAQNSYFQSLLDVASSQVDLQRALGQLK